MIEPLVVEFEVGVPPGRAFELWTGRCVSWWPPSHTVSGEPAAIEFEPRPGGRIFERGPGGEEHDWGEVVVWEPPGRIRYLWHLFFDRGEATEVEVSFTPAAGGTAVRLEQSGWDALGPAGPSRRTRTREVWGGVAGPRFREACRQDEGTAEAGRISRSA